MIYTIIDFFMYVYRPIWFVNKKKTKQKKNEKSEVLLQLQLPYINIYKQ